LKLRDIAAGYSLITPYADNFLKPNLAAFEPVEIRPLVAYLKG